MPRRTPLAWLDLTADKRRFAMSVVGVAFAVFLMLIEVGFLNGVYDSQTEVVEEMNADLFMINRLKDDVAPIQPFPRARLFQALATDGVDDVHPVYLEEFASTWKELGRGSQHIAMAIAFDPDHPVFLLPELAAHSSELRLPDTALFDARSRDFYGRPRPGQYAELAGRRIRVVGTFELGASFRWDGMILMSDTNFLRYFPDPDSGRPEPGWIEFGLIDVGDRRDVASVQRALVDALPDDVVVLTKKELVDRIRSFWQVFQPVGAIFGMGAAIGFVIGVTICYQILFSDIVASLPKLATLKAIGYTNWFLVRVVLQKALFLSACGYLPGVLLGASLYAVLEERTGIRMLLTPGRAALVFGLSVLMCVCAGLLAVRKAVQADPAELY